MIRFAKDGFLRNGWLDGLPSGRMIAPEKYATLSFGISWGKDDPITRRLLEAALNKKHEKKPPFEKKEKKGNEKDSHSRRPGRN